jgi:hypothetical protein
VKRFARCITGCNGSARVADASAVQGAHSAHDPPPRLVVGSGTSTPTRRSANGTGAPESAGDGSGSHAAVRADRAWGGGPQPQDEIGPAAGAGAWPRHLVFAEGTADPHSRLQPRAQPEIGRAPLDGPPMRRESGDGDVLVLSRESTLGRSAAPTPNGRSNGNGAVG